MSDCELGTGTMAPRLILVLFTVAIHVGCRERAPVPKLKAAAPAVEGDLVEPTPLLDLSASDHGDPPFFGVTAATRIPEGIAIADNGAHAIVVYDLSGKLVRRVGREGGGPGEFQRMTDLGRCAGDSVFVLDNGLKRMTVYDANLRMARVYRVPIFLHRMECSRRGIVAMLMQPKRFYPPSEMGRHPPSTGLLLLASPRGDTVATVGEIQLGEQRPLGRVTALAASENRLYVGSAETGAVEVYTFDGAHAGAVTVTDPPRQTTPEEYAAEIDRLVRSVERRGPDSVLRAMFASIPRPEHVPAYRDVTASPGGVLWVTLFSSPESTTVVRAIDSAGRLLGTARFPPQTRLLEVGSEFLLTVYEGANGEPHLGVYRLGRSLQQ